MTMITKTMKNNVIVQRAVRAKQVMDEVQKDLLALCRDKNYDINDRFSVWSELVEKVDHEFLYDFKGAPSIIRDYEDHLEEKYRTHDWSDILNYALDHTLEYESTYPQLDWSNSQLALEQYNAWRENLLLNN